MRRITKIKSQSKEEMKEKIHGKYDLFVKLENASEIELRELRHGQTCT